MKIEIKGEYIELAKLLKFSGIIHTGGVFHIFVEEHQIKVNGELESRKGKKVYKGDTVEITDPSGDTQRLEIC